MYGDNKRFTISPLHVRVYILIYIIIIIIVYCNSVIIIHIRIHIYTADDKIYFTYKIIHILYVYNMTFVCV